MGTDCKSAAFQLRWFESTRAHKKTVSVEIRWRFSVCRRFEFSCGWIRTAAALSQKTAQKQPSGLFLAARLATSTRAHQKTATYQNTLRFCFTILFPAISASPSHQSSCARILFCTISPAGVRARMRPSKVAYPARTQFCTKAICAVENCLPYRAL